MVPVGPPNAEMIAVVASGVVLATVHLSAGRLQLAERDPRSRWLSIGGGVSVAYVFVHLFPEVGEAATTIERRGAALAFAEHYGYLLALLGFVVFYGLELVARRGATAGDPDDGIGVFWIHLGSFAIYNGVVGFLLLDRELGGLPAYVVAMALHFVVIDAGMRHHHGEPYDRWGRWLLASSIVAGLVAGHALETVELLFAVFVPFLSGGVVLNAIKDELPAERESRFWAFAGGALGFAGLLLFA